MTSISSLFGGGLIACTLVALAGPVTAEPGQKHLTLAGITGGSVAPSGLAFVHIGGTPSNHNNKVDGSISLGFGFGDAQESIGGQLTAHIVSLTDEFADSGHFSLKLSRALNQNTYLGLQVERLGAWGDAGDIDINTRLALTWFGALPLGGDSYPLMVTIGAGDGVRNSGRDAGVFGGVGIGLSEHLAVSLAHTGEYVDMGLGIKLNEDIQLSAAVRDVFDTKDKRELSLSATYTFTLFGN